jgi:hypothetical protein
MDGQVVGQERPIVLTSEEPNRARLTDNFNLRGRFLAHNVKWPSCVTGSLLHVFLSMASSPSSPSLPSYRPFSDARSIKMLPGAWVIYRCELFARYPRVPLLDHSQSRSHPKPPKLTYRLDGRDDACGTCPRHDHRSARCRQRVHYSILTLGTRIRPGVRYGRSTPRFSRIQGNSCTPSRCLPQCPQSTRSGVPLCRLRWHSGRRAYRPSCPSWAYLHDSSRERGRDVHSAVNAQLGADDVHVNVSQQLTEPAST